MLMNITTLTNRVYFDDIILLMTSSKREIKMQQSPIKDKDLSQLQRNKQTVIDQLEYLFTYYASKLSRHNFRELSHKSYIDMMGALLNRGDSVLNTRITEDRKEYDILRSAQILYFSKCSKEGATFQQFLQLIPGLGRIVYYELKNRIEETEMITKDLLGLYQREVEKKISGKYINLDLSLEDDTIRYILKLAPQFLKIYKTYFSHEINKNIKTHNISDESVKSFFKFLKEFQVFPKLIAAGEICFIHKEVLENPQTNQLDKELKESLPYEDYKNNTGMMFTLGKMITALVVISKVANDKIKSNQDSNELEKDGFRSLLEYIEMTKAYKKQRYLKDTGKSFSFILLEEYPKELIKPPKLLAKDGKEITPKKEIEFLKILKKMDI